LPDVLDQGDTELLQPLASPGSFYPSRARGAVLAGVGTACCALARPRRICGLKKMGVAASSRIELADTGPLTVI
jgi:hypothetical protein